MNSKKLHFSTFILIILSMHSFGQTLNQRLGMDNPVIQQNLLELSLKFKAINDTNELKLNHFLLTNPLYKKTFAKNGSFYCLYKIDPQGKPVYINTKNKESGELIKVNSLYPNGTIGVDITGTDMVVGVWDGGQVRATHELLSGKATMETGQDLDGSADNFAGNNHQTHVSGTIIGRDLAGKPEVKGMAYNATSKNYDWNNDKSEMALFAGFNYLVSNHSYGYTNDSTVATWKFGAYDDESRNWDLLLKTTPFYLPFVAGGNEQTANGNMDKEGFDLMTGSSASKNVVTVGAVNQDKTMSSYSNWGPTDDGRMKPDLVAKGTGIKSCYYADKDSNEPSDTSYSASDETSSGTSYAAPAVAGASLLLQQYYKTQKANYMKAATLKALLLHTAEDLGNYGPDCKFGWGLVNVEDAANTIKNSIYTGTVSTSIKSNGTFIREGFLLNPDVEFPIRFTAAGGELKASIAFTDAEGVEQTDANEIDPTLSRMVYKYDISIKNVTQNNTITYSWKNFTMNNRTAIAEKSTGYFDGNMDVYKQALINANTNDEIIVYIKSNAANPSPNIPVSLIITGMKNENTSTNEANKQNSVVKLFPNPTNDKINIETKEKVALINVFSLEGKLLFETKNKDINLTDYANGIYLLEVVLENGAIIKEKVIKN